MLKVKYTIYEFIYERLQRVADRIKDLSEKFAICPDCGRNRYSGKPCKGV